MGSADAGSGPEHGRGEEPEERDRYADLPSVRVTVPDDARDLEADVRSYYRELKRRQGIADGPPPHATPPPPLERTRPGRMLIGIFALLLIVASLAMMISPRRQQPPVQAPLATTPAGADTRGLGEGLLLPDLRVMVGDVERPLRDLRPAVLALVPGGCSCQIELDTLIRETTTAHQIQLYLVEAPAPGTAGPDGRVTPPDPDRVGREQLVTLSRRPHISLVHDPSGKIAGGFSLGTLTIVLVATDGIVVDVRRGVGDLLDLDLRLAQLGQPGPAASDGSGRADDNTRIGNGTAVDMESAAA